MTVGVDGNVWYIDEANKSVGKLVISGSTATVTQYPITLPGGQVVNFARAIVGGPDAVWFVLNSTNTAYLGKVTSDGTMSVVPITGSNSAASGMVIGADGNIWYTEFLGRGVVRVTPQGAGTRYPLGADSNAISLGIVAGADQALWVALSGGKIYRVTASGAITEFPTGGTAGPLTLGADGNIWFTYSRSTIGRLRPDGRVTLYTLPDAQAYPGGLISGPDGNIWFTEHYDAKVGRIVVSSANDDGTAQVDVQSFGFTVGKGGDIVVLPAKRPANAARATDVFSGAVQMVVDYMDPSSGGDLFLIDVVPPPPLLTFTKTHQFDPVLVKVVSDAIPVIYTFTVRNVGVGPAFGPLRIVDLMPAQFTPYHAVKKFGYMLPEECGIYGTPAELICLIDDGLNAGESYEIKVSGRVEVLAGGQTITNVATLSTGATDSSAMSSNIDAFTAGRPLLEVTKTHTGDRASGTFAWKIKVKNLGPQDTDGPLTITDTLPSGVVVNSVTDTHFATCSVSGDTVNCRTDGNLVKGSWAFVTIRPSQMPPGRDLENTVTVSGGGLASPVSVKELARDRNAAPLTQPTIATTNGRS